MVYDDDGNILVQDRVDPDWPGLSFPGGHVEPGESFVESVVREVHEETGLKVANPILCGVKQFQDLNDNRYVVLLFKTKEYTGEIRSSDEGGVFWIHKSELDQYTLSTDFEDMFRVFESDTLSEFYYRRTNGEWQKKLL